MANTIQFQPIDETRTYTAARLNQLFQAIKEVLDEKLDVRASVIQRDIVLAGGSIINVEPPEQTGDLIPNGS